jgi:S-formylglutathione hydrolase FrmB
MLSVRIANPASEKRVVAILRSKGAADVEQALGEWRDGDWTDFDPVAAPHLVKGAFN